MVNATYLDTFILLFSTSLGMMCADEDDALIKQMAMTMRDKALSMHKTPITQGKGVDTRWVTQLPDKTKAGGRRTIRKQTKAEVEDVVASYYLTIMAKKKEAKVPIDISIADFFLKWIEYAESRPNIASETLRRYRNDFKRFIAPSDFGKLLVTQVDFIDIEEYLIETVREKSLKHRSLGNLYGYLKCMMEYGIRVRLINENPCFRVDLKNIRPYCDSSCKDDAERVLTDDESTALLKRIHEHQQEYPFYMADYAIEICMYTGLRVGEVVALTWSSINNGELIVNTSEHRVDHKDSASTYELGKTKNGKVRRIPISKELHSVFQRIRNLQEENGIDTNYILFEKGARLIAPTVSKAMYRRGVEANISAKSIHAIRRTVSSKLNALLPRATVALIMGHTEEVNENHYSYDVMELEAKRDAMSRILGNAS